MKKSRVALIVGAIVAAVIVAILAYIAFADDGDESEPTLTPTPSATPSPTPSPVTTPSPSPSPEFEAYPALGDLVVTTSGILPLTIGVAPEVNPGAEMIFLEEDWCYDEDFGITEGDLDRWIANYSMGLSEDGFEMRPFAVDAVVGLPLYRIDVFSRDLATPEGISIGSTLAELQATYPDLVAGSSGEISEVWWIEGDLGYVVFETQDNSDGLLPGVTEPEVILMRVIMADADPDFAAANSGDVAGACW